MAFLAPQVDEVGDEVDARLIGDHEARLQATTHAQTVGAELFQIGTGLLIEAYIDLS